MPGRDGYDVGFPGAVQVFARPAIGYMEVFVHGIKRNGLSSGGQGSDLQTEDNSGSIRRMENRIQVDSRGPDTFHGSYLAVKEKKPITAPATTRIAGLILY
jgi:hypothetical protein